MTDHSLPPDREDKLRRIRVIRDELIPALNEEYEELRDELIDEVEEDGYVYLIGADGIKYRATVTRQDIASFDIPTLERELDEEVLEEITERKVVRTKFEQAARAERIPVHVQTKAVRFKPKTPFLHYEKADRDAKAQ